MIFYSLSFLLTDDVNIPTEEMLFTAVIDWVNHDLSSRESSLPDLLSLLKLPLMSPEVSSRLLNVGLTPTPPNNIQYLDDIVYFEIL